MSLTAFAAMTIIAPWNMAVGQISMRWTQATGIIVAQLLGQKTPVADLGRLLASARRGAFVTAGTAALIFAVLCLSASVLYDDLTSDTDAILLGFPPILLVLWFPKATNAICGNTLRASGDTVFVIHVFVWSQSAFRVPATALACSVSTSLPSGCCRFCSGRKS